MKRLVISTIAVGVLAVGTAAALTLLPREAKAPTASTSPSVKNTPTATPNPLSITALRARKVTAGPITKTQSLANRGGCTTSIVSFQADGLTEYALLQLPATAQPAGGYPVVILAHGYIDPKTYRTDDANYQSFMNGFCAAGYATLKPDYRGNGASQGSDAIGDIEGDYSADILNLTASLINLPSVNANRVGWVGHSMGGAVVLRAGVASHNLPVKAIIFASGVVGSVDDTLNGWPINMFPADLAAQKQSFIAKYGSPGANPGFWHDISAINYVSDLAAPAQINHGTADAIVPIVFSQHLDAALTDVDKPHTFITYPGGDHQYTQNGSGAAFLKNAVAFLNQYLK